MERRVKEEMKPFAERLRKARLSKGIGVSELARQAGVDKSVISRLETGRGGASIATVHRLAKALEVPALDLLLGQPQEEPSFRTVQRSLEIPHRLEFVPRCGTCGYVISPPNPCTFCAADPLGTPGPTIRDFGVEQAKQLFPLSSHEADRVYRVENSSMAPALQAGDVLLVTKAVRPVHSDIVLFWNASDDRTSAFRLHDVIEDRALSTDKGDWYEVYLENLTFPGLERDPKDEYRGLVMGLLRFRGRF